MRQLPKRPKLADSIFKKLSRGTSLIKKASDKKSEAARRYRNVRSKAEWFVPLIQALRQMSGPGERCMFCSGSESSNVDHYRPKSVFPELALVWENMLWVCGVCNGSKLDKFPVEEDKLLINPVEENVWDFFFVDEFGLMTPRWNVALNAQEPRALSTVEIIGLDRQVLSDVRQQRLNDLKSKVDDSLILFKQGTLQRHDLKNRLKEWREQAFQPDVADYFLNGPGKEEEPFRQLFMLLN